MSFTKKAKNFNRDSRGMLSESTYFQLQYDPSLISIACSWTELSMRDQEKGRSPKKLKWLMDVPYVAHLKEKVLSFNMNLISSPQRIPRPSYRSIWGKVGEIRKSSFTEKAKIVDRSSLCIEVKEHVLSFNMILILSPQRPPRPSYLYPGNFGRLGKGSFTEKLKIVDRGCQRSALESTYLSCNMILISSLQRVRKLSCAFCERFGRAGKGWFT